MRLEMLAKDNNSGQNGCPAIYADLDRPGKAKVQGPAMSAAEVAEHMVNVLPGEGGVEIDEDVLLEAADAIRARRARG